jgi:hypothetical protein
VKRSLCALLVLAGSALAHTAPLPPARPWSGKSQELVAQKDDSWITPAERSGFRTSPSYDETVAWLRKLAAAAPELRMMSLGKSPEGRDIWMVVASKEKVFAPDAMRRIGKPTLFVQAGIHAGEIDGKDAGLMLLRDLTVSGRRHDLLERVNLLFVPIFNVDGHERASQYGRINQRGPEVIGWRTTSRNLNLNRDYTKLDSDEIRMVVSALNVWQPDLYYDIHVTDGADYQYDVTYGWNHTGYSPRITHWLDRTLNGALTTRLRSMGHTPGPLIFPAAGDDPTKGITFFNTEARFSNGYGDVRHLASVLVETHSLKSYEQRVLGTLVLLEQTLEVLAMDGRDLRQAANDDEMARTDPVPLTWRVPPNAPQDLMDFLAIESRTLPSSISGGTRTEWLGRPITLRVPVTKQNEVATSVPRAKAYWIPPAWSDVVLRMKLHGITVERVNEAREVDAEMYRLQQPKLDTEAFEGHVRLQASAKIERRKQRFPAGSYRIATDQTLGDLVTVLLEPSSPDSFLQWGFFDEILQRTEYVENYVLEPLAEKMLATDPKLAAEFNQRLETDEAFRNNPDRRLQFFYERSPYYDERWLL